MVVCSLIFGLRRFGFENEKEKKKKRKTSPANRAAQPT
jgi:hypothetical protein